MTGPDATTCLKSLLTFVNFVFISDVHISLFIMMMCLGTSSCMLLMDETTKDTMHEDRSSASPMLVAKNDHEDPGM
jgi:hypothetical protein